MPSLLEQIQSQTFFGKISRHKWKIFFAVLVLGGGYAFFGNSSTKTTEETVQFEPYTVSREDLSLSIESDGSMKNAKSVNLSFETSGTIEKILVEDGQTVKKGDVLAVLDTKTLQFEVEKANIALAVARANLAVKISANTKEDIALAENSLRSLEMDLENAVAQNKIALQTAKNSVETAYDSWVLAQKEKETGKTSVELDTQSSALSVETAEDNLKIAVENQTKNKTDLEKKLSQSYENAKTKYDSLIFSVKDALKEAEMYLEIDTVGYNLNYIFSAENPQLIQEAKDAYFQLRNSVREAEKISFPTEENFEKVVAALLEMEKLGKAAQNLTKLLSDGMDKTPSNAQFSEEKIATMYSALLSDQSKISSEINSLTTAKQNIETAELNLEKQILADSNAVLKAENQLKDVKSVETKTGNSEEVTLLKQDNSAESAKKNYENAILNFQNVQSKAEFAEKAAALKIENQKIQVQVMKNPPRQLDLVGVEQQVKSAEISLQKVQYDLDNASLKAPIDGQVLVVNVDEGETVKADSIDAVMTLISENSFEMETALEEADIAKISKGQKVYISLDALEGVELEGVVSSVANTATTDSSGVVTYLVKSLISNAGENGVKEGMTASATFVLSEAKDVLVVPVSAVKNRDGKPSVEKQDGSFVEVKTGFTDGKKVEILSGISEGETVMVKK